jgi:hypothetical protein
MYVSVIYIYTYIYQVANSSREKTIFGVSFLDTFIPKVLLVCTTFSYNFMYCTPPQSASPPGLEQSITPKENPSLHRDKTGWSKPVIVE